MAVTIDGRELLYAEMFSAVIDSNMHNRLALSWQTPIKRIDHGDLIFSENNQRPVRDLLRGLSGKDGPNDGIQFLELIIHIELSGYLASCVSQLVQFIFTVGLQNFIQFFFDNILW